ncbi:MAG: adenosylcobinamide-GDP ribazoletransferase [Devosiaceae bacterium]
MDFLFDFYRTLRFATRLPLPQLQREEDDPIVSADGFAPAFALTGLVPGLVGGLTITLALALRAEPLLTALLAVATMIMVTGALHEDGLADCADGIGGGRTVERKLEIMRDSAIGTYGVLALILSVGLRAAALASIAMFSPLAGLTALLATQTLSRAMAMLAASNLAHARKDGAAAALGSPSHRAAQAALAVGTMIALVSLLAGLGLSAGIVAALACAIAMLGATIWASHIARTHIGGQTGDILGAIQQLCDLAGLLVISICVGIMF